MVQSREATPDEENDREEEQDEKPEGMNGLVEVPQQELPAKAAIKGLTGPSDDPVRMYLREMGAGKLLSREGEIAIAKRIEAGRETIIAGLCESPLTFQAIVIWRDELNQGRVFLRDIIDLDATYTASNAKIGPNDQPVMAVPGAPLFGTQSPQTPATAPEAAEPFRAASEHDHDEKAPADDTPAEGDHDENDTEDWLSLIAIEAELKPNVIETFDTVASTYKKLRRLQDQDIHFQLRNSSLSPAQERKYKKLKGEIVNKVKSLRLNQRRIDSLVEQLYDINKRLVGYEGRMMRLAESHGVSREDFLRNYQGSELDPHWLNRMSKFSAKGWKSLA